MTEGARPTPPPNALPTVTRRRRRTRNVGLLVLADAVAIVASGLLATWLYFGDLSTSVSFENETVGVTFVQMMLLITPVWLVFLWLGGLYDLDRLQWGLGELGSITRALSLGVVTMIVGTFFLQMPGLSRVWTLLWWILAVIFVVVGRAILRAASSRSYRHGRNLRPTLVVGSNAEAADIVRLVRTRPESGLGLVGYLASSQAEAFEQGRGLPEIPCVGSARAVADVAGERKIDTVLIAGSAFDHDVLARMIAELRAADVDVHISAGLFEVLTSRVFVNEIAGVPLITIKGISLSRGNLTTKRLFDLGVAGGTIIIGLPLWLVLGVAIKTTSPGKVFYRQPRIGRQGRPFEMYKFRSMYSDADERLAALLEDNEATGPIFKMRDDPRVTPIGRWMRKLSLDEFPQLINVIKGEMSLVGPRPPLPREVDEYTAYSWRRLEVVPGMTGLWQVSGRSTLTFEEMVRLDLFYIENWSVGLDVTLLFRTIPAVVTSRGAY